MSKPKPLNFGIYYHIFNRGNNRETVFCEQRNYIYFLKLYEKYILTVADTFAYCLLPNHFHLLVRIKTAEEQMRSGLSVKSPSQQFGNLFNAYTKAFNKVYQRTGNLFHKPFGRLEITSDAYFTRLIAYIHQNPERHGLIDDFQLWPYTSYRTILSQKNTYIQRERVLNWFGSKEAYHAYHQEIEIVGDLDGLILEEN